MEQNKMTENDIIFTSVKFSRFQNSFNANFVPFLMTLTRFL